MPIPRALVAAALDLPADTDALPPGDLPERRLAHRLAAFLAREDVDPAADDAWTAAVMDRLIAEDPERALAVILAGLDHPDAAALSDPLLELGEAPAMRAAIEALAEDDPRLAALIAR